MDKTSLEMELILNSQIGRAISDKTSSLPVTGFCHYCDELIREGVFCDADCREDYEYVQKRKR